MLNHLYAYILNIFDLIWLGFMAYQPCRLFNYLYPNNFWRQFSNEPVLIFCKQLNSLKHCCLLLIVIGRVFANCPGDWGSIPGRVIPKTQKWYLMPLWLTFSILNICIKGKWSKERSSTLPYSVVAIEKGMFESPSTTDTKLLHLLIVI